METEIDINGLKFKINLTTDGAPCVVYSCNGIRLRYFEYDSNEAANTDYDTIYNVLYDVQACLNGELDNR